MSSGGFSAPMYGGSFGHSGGGPMFWGQSRGQADHGEPGRYSPLPPRARRSPGPSERDRYPPRLGSDDRYPPRYIKNEPLPRAKAEKSPNQKQEPEEDQSMGTILADFASSTSLQGLNQVLRSNRLFPKALWSLVFVGAVGATIFQFYLVLSTFYKRETTTKVIVNFDNLDFPSVTFCNLNPIRRSEMLELAEEKPDVEELKDFLDQFKPPKDYRIDRPPRVTTATTTRSSTSTNEGLSTVSTTTTGGVPGMPMGRKKRSDHGPDPDFDLAGKPPYNHFEDSGPNWNYTSDRYEDGADDDTRKRRQEERHRESAIYGAGEEDPEARLREEFQTLISFIPKNLRAQLGHSLKLMMLNCVFNGRVCQLSNFTGFLDVNYGNCFTFNSHMKRNSSLRVLSSGVDAGLNLLMYIESPEHIPGMSLGSGLRMDIHPFKTMPFLWRTGLSVPSGAQTYLGLTMTNLSRMGKPYHPCNNDTQFLRDYNLRYTKETCLNTCHERLIAEQCKCFRREAENLYPRAATKGASKLRPCDSNADLQCAYEIKSQRDAVLAKCSCLDACREVQYDHQTSSSIWPEIALWFPLVDAVCRIDNTSCGLLHDVMPHERENTLRNNFLYLRIYYRDLNFQTIKQEAAYDQSQFLSDLGGTAGLYLGASFLTFLELIDLTFSCCASCCCCRGRGKRPKERRPKGSRYPEDDDRGRDRRYGDMYRSDLDFYNDPAARYDQGLRFRP